MEPTDLEADFDRFRRTGDPDALARVFDRTAPRLLLAAAHFGITDAAEDLVHATFVRAIESAASFDARRELLPWLVGILANQARMTRRSAGRVLDPTRVRAADEPDPAAEAEAAEVASEVSRALDAIPETYRHILILHVVHGLKGIEIAHSLGRSPETVRTQLRRGLELLRKTLPKGLAIPAVLLCGTPGLASVRVALLARVSPTSAAAATAAAIGGLFAMKKFTFAVAVLLVAACLFVAWDSWFASAGPSPVDDWSAAAGAELAIGRGPEAVSPALPEEPKRTAASAPAPGKIATSVVRGRCVADDTGHPLARCVVSWTGTAVPESVALIGSLPWTDPFPVTTGADGRFELSFAPPATHQFILRIEAPGRVPLGSTWSDFEPGKTWDAGDVRLAAGSRLEGRVLDPRGEPLHRASVTVEVATRMTPASPFFSRTFAGQSDADGRFMIEQPLPPGTWTLGAQGPDDTLIKPRHLVVAHREPMTRATLTVRRGDRNDTISGTVVDDLGTPLADVLVGMGPPGPVGAQWPSTMMEVSLSGFENDPSSLTTRTAADGSFVLRRRTNDPRSITLTTKLGPYERVHATGPMHAGRPLVWGATGVRLVTRRTTSLEVEVVDRETGDPVEEFAIRCFAEDTERGDPGQKPRLGGTHARGRVLVDALSRGRNVLIVLPRDARWCASDPIVFDPAEVTASPLRVELTRTAELEVHVVRQDGVPVAGTTIDLVAPDGENAVEISRVGSGPADASVRGGRWQWSVLLDSRASDPRGVVRLRGPASRQDLALRARGPGHAPALRKGVAMSAGSVRFEVEGGATVHGRVLPPGIVAQLSFPDADPTGGGLGSRARVLRPGIVLANERQKLRHVPTGNNFHPVDDDGSFRIDGVPEGTWEVRLLRWKPVRRGVETDWRGAYMQEWLQEPLTTIELEPGERRELELDLRAFVPVRLECLVLLGGVPLSGIEVRFEVDREKTQGRPGESWSVGGRTDGQGRLVIEHLLSGVYRPYVDVVDSQGLHRVKVVAPDWLRLDEPGTTVRRTIDLPRSKLSARFVGADGVTPVSGRPVRVSWLDEPPQFGIALTRFFEFTTGRDGTICLDPAPSGSFQIMILRELVHAPPPENMPFDSFSSVSTHFGPVASSPVAHEFRLPADR